VPIWGARRFCRRYQPCQAANRWEFGDGIIVSNRPVSVVHGWTKPGDYAVVFRAYNDSYPEGVSATFTVRVSSQPVHYVAVDSASPVFPYTSWATAARDIQDAVDAASVPGALVLVTNGVYNSGWRTVGTSLLYNRVVVDKPLALRSVNGPEFTLIEGAQAWGGGCGEGAIRCVYLATGASLSGFTLTNGATWRWEPGGPFERQALEGGGAFSGSLYHCTLSGNSAPYGGGASESTLTDCTLIGNRTAYAEWGAQGGGAYNCTLNRCTLGNNSASSSQYDFGGGALGCTLTDCTLTSNTARGGAGASQSTLNRCALIGNRAEEDGSGAIWSTLNYCTLTGNSAHKYNGGGAAMCTLSHCVLTRNSARNDGGGGASGSTLNHCTVVGNSASQGGGVFGGKVTNSIVCFNTATIGANYHPGYNTSGELESLCSLLTYCCTTPHPGCGLGIITNAPLFMDTNEWANLRLQPNSPCINAGLNAAVQNPTDLAGLPRIVSDTVDVGAYEFQEPGSVISYAWLQQYGLPTDGSADFIDLDADGHTTWQEWRCQTDPTNTLSVLHLLSVSSDGSDVTVRWQSVEGMNYLLERSTDLGASPAFKPVATGLPGQFSSTTYTDTDASALAPLFYRVGPYTPRRDAK